MRLVLAAGRLLENSGRCSMIQQKNKEKRKMEKTEKYPTPKMKKKKNHQMRSFEVKIKVEEILWRTLLESLVIKCLQTVIRILHE